MTDSSFDEIRALPPLEARVAGASRWTMRRVGPDDEPFLDDVYADARLDEVVAWGFRLDAARDFLRDQARTQRRAFGLQFPGGEHWALQMGDRTVGRVIVAPDAPPAPTRALRLVDIAVLPPDRGRGIGGWAVREVMRRARRAAVPLRLRLPAENPARHLFETLGFRATGADRDGQVGMEWAPVASIREGVSLDH